MPRLRRLVLLAAASLACSRSPAPDGSVASSNATVVAPERGSLVVVGGGRVGPDIVNEFLRLAGGRQAAIVVIPTAGGDTAYTQGCTCTRFLREAGATDVTVLHTYDPKRADTEEFVAPIRRASAVWFPGGRQWRLADAYLGTRTERELHALLARGGVIGGSSAGASIQASYLVRGAPEGNTIMMSPGHEKGFGFLRDVAVDQHVLARNRLNDLPEVLAKHRQLLGIGIDEGTAIVVQRDTFTVLGASKVFVYGGRDTTDSGKPYRTLHPGDRYDLRFRRLIGGP
jgi:cyanophycinase